LAESCESTAARKAAHDNHAANFGAAAGERNAVPRYEYAATLVAARRDCKAALSIASYESTATLNCEHK
jgi:hypothetical protein